ncbi:alpha/beta fold hydrolase [Hymenobacter coccineus]|uniref:Sigma factor sigB regulation protein rsbQ n=1 Tax=Hymenobacter coccineus TaxID=1908235 RepID=A0A1G1TIV5_9BACT|nr:alpha/beta hydrolase [Hymenobacter coccineus]OGX90797.1 sigma factor sigB regulation protein rsbQ [Hymenobacter coccineus]
MVDSVDTSAVRRSHATVTGAGHGAPAIVFSHGLGADQSTWRLLAPAFEKHYQVVRFDLVGAGQSDPTAYDYDRHGSLNGHADDLLDVLRELDLRDVVFVGHSVSSMIGVLAAIKEPARFARLVLLAPSPRFINDNDYCGGFEQADIDELLATMENNYHGWAGALAATVLPDQRDLIAELTNSFLSTNPELARHFARVTFLSDHRRDLPLLATPVLILQGACDAVVPLTVGSYLHELLPNSQLRIIAASGHFPQLTAPYETLAAIDAFLPLAVA